MLKFFFRVLCLCLLLEAKAQVANFTYVTPGDSCKSRTVQFNAGISTGSIASYEWSFRNLTTSTSLGSFTSSGSAGAGGSGNILNSLIGISSNNIVDNNAYVYYLRVSAVNSMNIAAVWDGVNLTINQVKITYSY